MNLRINNNIEFGICWVNKRFNWRGISSLHYYIGLPIIYTPQVRERYHIPKFKGEFIEPLNLPL